MKYFSISSISIGTGCFVQVSKFGKHYSHLPIEQLVPFLVWGQHTPIHKRFLKNTTNNTRLLSLSWIRKGSCQSRTLDLLLCKLYSYWGIILLYFLDISDRLLIGSLPDLFTDTWGKEESLFLPLPTLRFRKHSLAKRMTINRISIRRRLEDQTLTSFWNKKKTFFWTFYL